MMDQLADSHLENAESNPDHEFFERLVDHGSGRTSSWLSHVGHIGRLEYGHALTGRQPGDTVPVKIRVGYSTLPSTVIGARSENISDFSFASPRGTVVISSPSTSPFPEFSTVAAVAFATKSLALDGERKAPAVVESCYTYLEVRNGQCLE